MIIDVLEYLPPLVKILNDLPISEHRLNIVKMHGRRKGKVAGWNDVVKVAEKLHPSYKLSVKRQEQPFLFFDPNGSQGVPNVLRT
jgi:hypothetical protein